MKEVTQKLKGKNKKQYTEKPREGGGITKFYLNLGSKKKKKKKKKKESATPLVGSVLPWHCMPRERTSPLAGGGVEMPASYLTISPRLARAHL